jgi:hypothetical protein
MQEIINLAQKGFKFFPCKSDKSPATKGGFYDATNDAEKINEIFDNNFLIGFPCGNLNFNIIVLDIDINKDGDTRTVDELLENLEERLKCSILKDGFQVETRTGGRHLYFKAPEGVRITGGSKNFGKDLPIDLRATGQYVIFPDEKNYFVYDSDIEIDDFFNHLPDLPEEIINFKKNPARLADDNLPVNILPPEEIREIRSALSYLDSDDRDIWIKVGMSLKSTNSPSAFGLWDEWSKTSDKYNPNDMNKRWRGLKPFDISIASLFHEAKKTGWVSTYQKQMTEIIPPFKENTFKKIEKYKKKPFPEYLLRPDGLVGEIIDFILEKSVMPQPVFALSAALCAVGTLAGRKVQTETGIRTNIYCCNIGDSGCGKDAPRRALKILFQEADCGLLAKVENLASDSAIASELQKAESQVFLLDEIGKFLETTKNGPSYLSGVVAELLRLYGSADQEWSGKSYADVDRKKIIQQPNLSILGTTTPDTLYKGLNYENVTDGFLSRILLFETDNNRPKFIHNKNFLKKPCNKLIEKIKKLLHKPIKMNPEGNLDHILVPDPQVIYKTEGARFLLEQFREKIYDIRDKLAEEKKIDAIYNRTTQTAEQIALIIAVGTNIESPVITEKEMGYGIALAKYLSDHLNYIVENYMAKNELEHEVKRILNLIREHGRISLKEISKNTQNISGHVRADILQTLKNSEQIEESILGEGMFARKMYTAL